MIYTATGHTFRDLPDTVESRRAMNSLARSVMASNDVTRFICGMAPGWDQYMCRAACDFHIPFEAVIPFPDCHLIWSPADQQTYHTLIHAAEKVHVVNPGPFEEWKLAARNVKQIELSQGVLALWNGLENGGTAQTIHLAEEAGRPILNFWDDWCVLVRASLRTQATETV